jgi:hypothetical protein
VRKSSWQGKLDVQDIRIKERAEAYRQLLLAQLFRVGDGQAGAG